LQQRSVIWCCYRGVLGVNSFFFLQFLTIKVRANKLLRMVEILVMRLAGDFLGEFLLLR
jgi:hypothetical protein